MTGTVTMSMHIPKNSKPQSLPHEPASTVRADSATTYTGQDRRVQQTASTAQAFAAFYSNECQRVVGLAYVLSGNRWHAEDLAHDAFVAAFVKWSSVSRLEKPAMWVNRVVANRSVSHFRKTMNEAKAWLRLSRLPEQYETLDEHDLEFWRIVRSLPRKQAQAIALYYVNDMSVAQIAHVLECSEGSVKTHLSRGRQTVLRELGHEEGMKHG